MKVKDIIFIIIFLFFIYKHNPKLFIWSGLFCLVLSIPLFAFWVFFTAERLVWYASIFLFVAVLLLIKNNKKVLK